MCMLIFKLLKRKTEINEGLRCTYFQLTSNPHYAYKISLKEKTWTNWYDIALFFIYENYTLPIDFYAKIMKSYLFILKYI